MAVPLGALSIYLSMWDCIRIIMESVGLGETMAVPSGALSICTITSIYTSIYLFIFPSVWPY